MTRIFLLTLLGLLLSPPIADAQNLLSNPEHVVFDPINQRYLVTNYGNGRIIAIDQNGDQETIITGVSGCLGIHVVDTIIYITCGATIRMYGLNSYSYIGTISLSVTTWLDGMIDDQLGNLYIAENAGKIHKVDLNTLADTIVVSQGLPTKPQDLAFDPSGPRLLVVCWQTGSPIVSVDLPSYTVSDFIPTTSGQYDGIVIDSLGNIYITSWLGGGRVLKWGYPYINSPVVISSGHAGPAGLGLNVAKNLLAVPNFNGNSITYVSPTPTGIEEVKGAPAINNMGDIIEFRGQNPMTLVIHDIAGRKIHEDKYHTSVVTKSLKTILGGHARGIYVITLRAGDSSSSMKVLL